MNRILASAASLLGAAAPFVLDSALKGTALLVIATFAAATLQRASAAARHLVWLIAVAALLAVPLLSLALPEWRVLPRWPAPPGAAGSPVVAGATVAIPLNTRRLDQAPAAPARTVWPAAAFAPMAAAEPFAPTPQPRVAIGWRGWASLIWACGAAALAFRLLTAHVLLRSAARACRTAAAPADDALLRAFDAALLQLGIRRRVQLLVGSEQRIPVVWGVLRPRLLLPAEARRWSDDQLRSVLLHELAHVRRRDTLAQWLAQLASALHWWNPLVWMAAWRLHVERERACDDLVLACGVRPSAYAEHLLDVATRLAPAPWTRACGLAMARRSSLEGRLLAVLSDRLNRQGVTAALAALALAAGTLIAVPLAMLGAADDSSTPVPEAPAPGGPAESSGLDATTETRLQWGPPSSGLRAALVRPQAFGEPEAREIFDFLLVLQNAGDAPLRLDTASSKTYNRLLKVRKNGVTLAQFHDAQSRPVQILLKPRQIARLRMFTAPQRGMSITADDPAMTFAAEVVVEDAAAGAWTGAVSTGDTCGAFASHGLAPRQDDARALFKIWAANARRDGRIPGAQIGLLAASIATFTESNPTWETAPRLLALVSRLDSGRDWSGLEAVALLEEVAAAQTTPVAMALEAETLRIIRTGTPLSGDLAGAPWGTALRNGLRVAWLLEPRAAAHRIGTSLRARVLIHNSGTDTVVFRTRTWHQRGHSATDGSGDEVEVEVESWRWTTLGTLTVFRLAPGEVVELAAPGIGVGDGKEPEDREGARVGSWIKARAGDTVTVTTDPVPLHDWNDEPAAGNEAGWWLAFIRERLARELPLPAGAEEREALLYRVAIDLFGTPVSAGDNAAFARDDTESAMESLARRLARSNLVTAWAGSLTSAPTAFRVLPADPDAGRRPRAASSPGRYTLGDGTVLVVTRRAAGERIINEAHIERPEPVEPVAIGLPEGYDSWSVAWARGDGVLWLKDGRGVHRYDLSDRPGAQEEPVDPGDVPASIREALDASPPFGAATLAAGRDGAAPPPAEKHRAAARTGRYDLGGGRVLYVCQPAAAEQRFSIYWPGAAGKPRRSIKVLPNGAPGTRWMVVFQSGGDQLWWADERDVGTVRVDDPEHVVIERASRRGGIAPGLALPGEAREIFQAHGITIGRGSRLEGEPPRRQVLAAQSVNATAAEHAEADAAPLAYAGTATLPERAYIRSGIPIRDFEEPMTTWAPDQDGLCVGLRVVGEEWRIGGEVKLELWVCNAGADDVRFQMTPRVDIGLTVRMRDAAGKTHDAAIPVHDTPPFASAVLLPREHIYKVKELMLRLTPPEAAPEPGDRRPAPQLALPPGKYTLQCEAALPGITQTDGEGLQRTPARGEWTGTVKSSDTEIEVLPERPAGGRPATLRGDR